MSRRTAPPARLLGLPVPSFRRKEFPMVKDRQVKVLRHWLQREATLSVAALKTGMDRKTARKYRRGKLPSEDAREHDWQTRWDAFAEVWAEVQSLLEVAPGL